jgi:hypothetical protein
MTLLSDQETFDAVHGYCWFTELTVIQNIEWEQGVCAERALFFNGSTPESQSIPEFFYFLIINFSPMAIVIQISGF